MKLVNPELWELIKEHIPQRKSLIGRPEANNELALNGILYVLRTGCQWKNLPECFGKKSTVHDKYLKWTRLGFFNKMHAIMLKYYIEHQGKHGIWCAIDSTSIKAPLGGSRTGKNPTDRGKKRNKKKLDR